MLKTAFDDCARRFDVLSEPTRLSVVRLLFDRPRHVGELQAALDIEQSLLSHHLRLLRDSGIVTARRDGKQVLYRLHVDVASRRGGRWLDFGCCRIRFD